MILFLLFYVVIVFFLLWKLSIKKRLYIFSPFLIIYFKLAAYDIIPLLMYKGSYPVSINIWYVTVLSAIINLLFLYFKWHEICLKPVIIAPVSIKRFENKRYILITFLIILLFAIGIYTGVMTSLLHGVNVENLRRTSEVGLGFVTQVPHFGVTILLLSYLLSKKKLNYKLAALICLTIGFLLFCFDAARAHIAASVNIFLAYFCIRKRALKWYEYIGLFYLISPIVATFLFILRGGGGGELSLNHILLSHQNLIFGENTIKMVDAFEKMGSFLMGLSYTIPIATVIPRFIWPEKPMSIDYYYKEVAGLEFEGGGIYTTIPMDFYINFGFYFVLAYAAWILVIHYMYRKLISVSISYSSKIIYLCFITLYSSPGDMIRYFELYLLFAFICYFYYGRRDVI